VKINLDGLNPCNTFERRLLEAISNGESLPVNVHFHTEEIERRLKALENRPTPENRPPVLDDARVGALERQVMDLMKAVQLLLQAHEDQKNKVVTMKRILIELTDQIDTKLKATGT
jgi:hypothetical protein